MEAQFRFVEQDKVREFFARQIQQGCQREKRGEPSEVKCAPKIFPNRWPAISDTPFRSPCRSENVEIRQHATEEFAKSLVASGIGSLHLQKDRRQVLAMAKHSGMFLHIPSLPEPVGVVILEHKTRSEKVHHGPCALIGFLGSLGIRLVIQLGLGVTPMLFPQFECELLSTQLYVASSFAKTRRSGCAYSSSNEYRWLRSGFSSPECSPSQRYTRHCAAPKQLIVGSASADTKRANRCSFSIHRIISKKRRMFDLPARWLPAER